MRRLPAALAVRPPGDPGQRQSFEPRNMAFTDGPLDRSGYWSAVPRCRPGFAPVTGTRDWTPHEVTAQVPADAISIIFGFFLNGRAQIELRNPRLDPHPGAIQQAGMR